MTDQLLRVLGLRACYERRDVLHGIDLAIERGEWLGLMGPNGSGKSTLLACIAGRHPAAAGSVFIGGNDIARDALAAKRSLGFAVDPGLLPNALTGQQCLEVFASARGMTVPDGDTLELAQALQMSSALGLPVGHYSYGMRQKLAVLLAVLGDPALILLDEAFNGLDPHSGLVLQAALRARVAAHRCAVILATHGLNIIERCSTRVSLLHEGRFIRHWSANELAEVRATSGALEQAMADAMLSEAKPS